MQQLFILLQRLLPARLIGRAVYRLGRSRNRLLRNALIRAFVALYRVDTSEAGQPVPDGYDSFNAFFTRTLRRGSRPVDPDPAAVVSPADGTIQQLGAISGTALLQVKGQHYDVAELLADADAAAQFRDGAFMTVYLAPHDYHRIHMPLDARVVEMVHVPGQLWSVNAATVARVPRLFARNERLVCHCEAAAGRFAVVLVGAMNVGSISTAWSGEVLPRSARQLHRWRYPASDGAVRLGRGDPLGQFNLGSTVILLAPRGCLAWRPDLAPGRTVRVGERIGTLGAAAS